MNAKKQSTKTEKKIITVKPLESWIYRLNSAPFSVF
jgi:hypothetical protein